MVGSCRSRVLSDRLKDFRQLKPPNVRPKGSYMVFLTAMHVLSDYKRCLAALELGPLG